MPKKSIALSALLGCVGLFLVAIQIEKSSFLSSLERAQCHILLLYIPLFFINMIIRTARWKLLFPLQDRPSFFDAFNSLMLGNAANVFTPVRGGDILRAMTIGHKSNRSKSVALGTVLVERVSDLAFACLVMAITSSFIPFDITTKRAVFVLGSGLFILIIVVVLLSLLGEERILAMIPQIIPIWLRGRLGKMLWAFAHGVQRIGAGKSAVSCLILTIFIWLLEASCLSVVMYSLGIETTVLAIGGLMLFSTFGAMIPGPPGQVGVFEYVVTTGANLLGIGQGVALAVVWHGISLILIGLGEELLSVV